MQNNYLIIHFIVISKTLICDATQKVFPQSLAVVTSRKC